MSSLCRLHFYVCNCELIFKLIVSEDLVVIKRDSQSMLFSRLLTSGTLIQAQLSMLQYKAGCFIVVIGGKVCSGLVCWNQ